VMVNGVPGCLSTGPQAGIFAGKIGSVQLGRVAIYCRVSTDDQSCERRERDLRALAKRAGHEIWPASRRRRQVPTTHARSAPRLALARAHEIDAILVTELRRRGRSTLDLAQTLDDLHGWRKSAS
jgi:putative DNA-invertase from lambdoid prophage Rac